MQPPGVFFPWKMTWDSNLSPFIAQPSVAAQCFELFGCGMAMVLNPLSAMVHSKEGEKCIFVWSALAIAQSSVMPSIIFFHLMHSMKFFITLLFPLFSWVLWVFLCQDILWHSIKRWCKDSMLLRRVFHIFVINTSSESQQQPNSYHLILCAMLFAVFQ